MSFRFDAIILYGNSFFLWAVINFLLWEFLDANDERWVGKIQIDFSSYFQSPLVIAASQLARSRAVLSARVSGEFAGGGLPG